MTPKLMNMSSNKFTSRLRLEGVDLSALAYRLEVVDGSFGARFLGKSASS